MTEFRCADNRFGCADVHSRCVDNVSSEFGTYKIDKARLYIALSFK